MHACLCRRQGIKVAQSQHECQCRRQRHCVRSPLTSFSIQNVFEFSLYFFLGGLDPFVCVVYNFIRFFFLLFEGRVLDSGFCHREDWSSLMNRPLNRCARGWPISTSNSLDNDGPFPWWICPNFRSPSSYTSTATQKVSIIPGWRNNCDRPVHGRKTPPPPPPMAKPNRPVPTKMQIKRLSLDRCKRQRGRQFSLPDWM